MNMNMNMYKNLPKITSIQDIKKAKFIIDLADNDYIGAIVTIKEHFNVTGRDDTIIYTDYGEYTIGFLLSDNEETDFRVITKETNPEYFL